MHRLKGSKIDRDRFSIERDDDKRHATIRLIGEMDLARVTDARRALLNAARKFDEITVDTTQLTFIDSSGLGALVWARNTLGDRFTLIPGEATRRLLWLTDMFEFFGVQP